LRELSRFILRIAGSEIASRREATPTDRRESIVRTLKKNINETQVFSSHTKFSAETTENINTHLISTYMKRSDLRSTHFLYEDGTRRLKTKKRFSSLGQSGEREREIKWRFGRRDENDTRRRRIRRIFFA